MAQHLASRIGVRRDDDPLDVAVVLGILVARGRYRDPSLIRARLDTLLARLGLGLAGGFLAWQVLGPADPGGLAVAVSEATRSDLLALGITDQTGLVPRQLLSWEALGSVPGLFVLVVGGFLVGFGTRWADGCTSGHAITGLANLQYLFLANTQTTPEGVKKLRQALPNCDVEH